MVSYLQFDNKRHRVLHEDCFIRDANFDDKEVVKQLVSAMRVTPHALAIAANQIGIKAPFIILRNPIATLELFGLITLKTDLDPRLMHIEPRPVVIKDPVLWFYSDKGSIACRECCLSGDSIGEVTTLRKQEVGIIGKFLDMKAYSKNRGNLIWNRKTVDYLSGLGAQVLQHEMEHLHGSGIWYHQHIIKNERS